MKDREEDKNKPTQNVIHNNRFRKRHRSHRMKQSKNKNHWSDFTNKSASAKQVTEQQHKNNNKNVF